MKDDWLMDYAEACEYLAQVAEASMKTAAELSEAVAEISKRATTTCKTWGEVAAELAESWAAALPSGSDLQELADLAQEAEAKETTNPGGHPQPPRPPRLVGRRWPQPGSLYLKMARATKRLPRSG